jgi:hypothetical protein
MIAKETLRSGLAEFLGAYRFRKFVLAGVGSRMLYWQEREIERFREANPRLEFNLSDLEMALQFCPLHLLDLLPCSVDVFRGHLNWSQDYLNAMRSCFPFAPLDPVMVGEDFLGSRLNTFYCPECKKLAGEWQPSRA